MGAALPFSHPPPSNIAMFGSSVTPLPTRLRTGRRPSSRGFRVRGMLRLALGLLLRERRRRGGGMRGRRRPLAGTIRCECGGGGPAVDGAVDDGVVSPGM